MSSSRAINFSILSSILSRYSMSVNVAILKMGTIYSIGMSTSCPYTKQKGIFPINFFHVVLYSHNTTWIHKSQSFMFTLHTFVRAFSYILLKALTVPFTWGWYSVFFWGCTWNYSVYASIALCNKCEPLSLIKIFGQQNLDRIYSNMNYAVVYALQSFTGFALAHLVK